MFLSGTPFPGQDKLKEWDSLVDALMNGVKSALNGGSLTDTSMYKPISDPVINFYLQNKPWLEPAGSLWSVLGGTLQSVVYSLFTVVASIATMLMRASLYLFQVIPNALMDKNSALHGFFWVILLIAVGLMAVTLVFWAFNYLRGAKTHVFTTMVVNVFTSILMLIGIPFLTVFIGYMLNTYMGPLLGSTNQNSLSMQPLVDNTVDMETWALDGFAHKPFSGDAPVMNNLDAQNAFVPDFTETIDGGQISEINSFAGKMNNVSKSGVNIQNVGDVFKYQVRSGQTDNAAQQSNLYTVTKIDVKGTWGIDAVSTRYKRYKVQNITAILAYAVLILFSTLMSLKIGKAAIGSVLNMIGSIIAVGRDVANAQQAKTMMMDSINTGLGVTLDLLFIWLFPQVLSTWPNAAREYVATLGPVGEVAGPFVYVLTMIMVAWGLFNGSSAVERIFGMDSGLNESVRSGAQWFAVGSMLGSPLAQKMAERRDQKQIDKLMSENQDAKASQENGNGTGLANNGSKGTVDELTENGNSENNTNIDNQGATNSTNEQNNSENSETQNDGDTNTSDNSHNESNNEGSKDVQDGRDGESPANDSEQDSAQPDNTNGQFDNEGRNSNFDPDANAPENSGSGDDFWSSLEDNDPNAGGSDATSQYQDGLVTDAPTNDGRDAAVEGDANDNNDSTTMDNRGGEPSTQANSEREAPGQGQGEVPNNQDIAASDTEQMPQTTASGRTVEHNNQAIQQYQNKMQRRETRHQSTQKARAQRLLMGLQQPDHFQKRSVDNTPDPDVK
jgi:hypothetical protein